MHHAMWSWIGVRWPGRQTSATTDRRLGRDVQHVLAVGVLAGTPVLGGEPVVLREQRAQALGDRVRVVGEHLRVGDEGREIGRAGCR